MKYIKIILLLCIILPIELFPSGGSYYSRFGLGDFYYSFTARRMGMGELGIAALDHDYLNNLNPASWSNLRLTRFETGMIFHGTKINSSVSDVFHSQTIFSGMMIGFPISVPNGISLVAGITPYTNVSYEVAEQIDSNVVDKYKLTYQGIGGISKVFFGLSYKLPFDISLGSSFDYYNGKVNYSTDMDFESSASYNDVTYNKEFSYHGIGFTIGMVSNNFAEMIGWEDMKELRLGFSFSSKVDLSTDTVSSSKTIIGTINNSSLSYKSNLPLRFGAGLSVNFVDQYQVMLDYLYQPLSEYNKNGVYSQNIRDFYKVSLGLEYRKARPESQSFWEHVMLRCGLSYEQSQYTFEGEGINQTSVYAGFSMPLGYDNTIDFGFQYGKRGTLDKNLLNENIYKFSISLSIGELWFLREDR
jgi:hypothetical protein